MGNHGLITFILSKYQKNIVNYFYSSYKNNFLINSYIRKSTRHDAKQDSSRMIIDEPSNGIDAIEMNEEPSTSEHQQ